MNSEMPCDVLGRLAQPVDDFAGAGAALVARFEVDVEAAGVDGGVDRARADERRHADHIRVLAHDVGDDALAFDHRLERDGLRGVGHADDQAGVLLRQQAFGHDDVQPDRGDQGGDGDRQGQRLMLQHPLQAAVVPVEHPFEHPLASS